MTTPPATAASTRIAQAVGGSPAAALPTASRPRPGDTPDHARPPDQGAPVLCPIIAPGRIESTRAERPEPPEALHGDRLELLHGSHQRIMGERDLLRTRRPHPVCDEQPQALPEVHPGDPRPLWLEGTGRPRRQEGVQREEDGERNDAREDRGKGDREAPADPHAWQGGRQEDPGGEDDHRQPSGQLGEGRQASEDPGEPRREEESRADSPRERLAPGPEGDDQGHQHQGLAGDVGHGPTRVHPVERVDHQEERRQQPDATAGGQDAQAVDRDASHRPEDDRGPARGHVGRRRHECLRGVEIPRLRRGRAGPALAHDAERHAEEILRERGEVIGGTIEPGGVIPPAAQPEVGIVRLRKIRRLVHEMRF